MAILLVTVPGVAGLNAAPAPTAHPVGDRCAITSPNEPGSLSEVAAKPLKGVCKYLEGRNGVAQVGLFDKKSGKTYLLSTGSNAQYTASSVKVDILAMWLHKLQQQGTPIPGGIPYSIQVLMQRSIQNSDNYATTALFYFAGGCNALTAFNRLLPLNNTTVGCENSVYWGWGNTLVTAADQLTLVNLFAYGGRDDVLGNDARSYGLHLMRAQDIQDDQRWGVTCGPWGRSCSPTEFLKPVPGVTISMKTGDKTFPPANQQPPPGGPTCDKGVPKCPFQVNSMGWVSGKGRNYVLAVLTTDNPIGDPHGLHYGIDTIQNVSLRVWDNLG